MIMSKRNSGKSASGLLLGSAIMLALGTTSCGSGNSGAPQATPQGTISLDSVKLGMPDSVFQDAILTFVPDPKGTMGGKIQFLSRGNDANGGQYVAECKDGACYSINIHYAGQPVPRSVAMETMKKLYPVEAPSDLKGNNKGQHEFFKINDEFEGALNFADKKREQVDWVSAWRNAPKSTASATKKGAAQ